MSRSKALLGLTLIFVLGIVAGVSLSIRLSMMRVKEIASGTREELAILTVARIDKAVRFTPEQRVKARAIVLEAERKISEEQQRIAPEIEAITHHARRELLSVMTPQQLTKLPASLQIPPPQPSTPTPRL